MKYIFPFKRCTQLNFTNIVIFGAGVIGCSLQEQIAEKAQVKTIGFVDNFITTEAAPDIVKQIGVHTPKYLKNAEYDCIILACRETLIPELCECLFNLGIKSNKIILPLFYNDYIQPNIGSGWNHYYAIAEDSATPEFEKYFIPFLTKHNISLGHVLDFPSGRGRIAEVLYKNNSEKIDKIMCCDANGEAIEYCRERFSENDRFAFLTNTVDDNNPLPLEIGDNSFSFIYSWDAMVHFSYKWLDFYIGEFFRILQDGGYVFIHHSNLGACDATSYKDISENFNENLHWRSSVCANDVKYIAEKHGFCVVQQRVIDWVDAQKIDCISLLKKSEK